MTQQVTGERDVGELGALDLRMAALVARPLHRLQREQVPVVEQELARHRLGVVAVRLLDQKRVAEFVRVAAERERVLVVPLEAVRDAASDPWVLAFRGRRAVRIAVTLGARGGAVAEVAKGLEEGRAAHLGDRRERREHRRDEGRRGAARRLPAHHAVVVPVFEAARTLYAGAGFTPCPPFGAYREDRHSVFMTLELTR